MPVGAKDVGYSGAELRASEVDDGLEQRKIALYSPVSDGIRRDRPDTLLVTTEHRQG